MWDFVKFDDFFKLKPSRQSKFNYVSLFSGAGFGDYGLKLAGGKCLAACEIDPKRAEVHKANLAAPVIGNICTNKEKLLGLVGNKIVDLLIATPPCQSFSSANSKRGSLEDPEHASRDARNLLFFEVLSIAHSLRPKIVFFENVPNFLERKVRSPDGKLTGKVREFISASLTDYLEWSEVICFSSLGVPQRRKRSIALFIRKDCVNGDSQFPETMIPKRWPKEIKGLPLNILDALKELKPLDGIDAERACCNLDKLHQVPVYDSIHYSWICGIPSNSNKSAWENPCPNCGFECESGLIVCDNCHAPLFNRPHVKKDDGAIRLIKGFNTSYKRMSANEIAPTITTNSGSFSSDLKLHPSQNRVLSPRECARLQTIPNTFEWPEHLLDKKAHGYRCMIGEAVPPLVTYRLGQAINKLLLQS
jgi:DNA (cytosine-5)-methyltransferase 1